MLNGIAYDASDDQAGRQESITTEQQRRSWLLVELSIAAALSNSGDYNFELAADILLDMQPDNPGEYRVRDLLQALHTSLQLHDELAAFAEGWDTAASCMQHLATGM